MLSLLGKVFIGALLVRERRLLLLSLLGRDFLLSLLGRVLVVALLVRERLVALLVRERLGVCSPF